MALLMDLCRGTQEVEAVLSECRDDDDSCPSLARLKMAIEYDHVSNTLSCFVYAFEYVIRLSLLGSLRFCTSNRNGWCRPGTSVVLQSRRTAN